MGERYEPGKHLVVVGASGRRAGCRVCRISDQTGNLKPNPRWTEPCWPSREALAQFENVARERIAEAENDLEFAAMLRARSGEHQLPRDNRLCSHAGSCEDNLRDFGGAFCANLPEVQLPRDSDR